MNSRRTARALLAGSSTRLVGTPKLSKRPVREQLGLGLGGEKPTGPERARVWSVCSNCGANRLVTTMGAALALSWYLLAPPMGSDGHFDVNAPIKEWSVLGAMDTVDECETKLGYALTHDTPGVIEQSHREARRRGLPVNLTVQQTIERLNGSKCVSGDDIGRAPR